MHTCMCVYGLLSIVLAIKVFCTSIWISGFFFYVKNVMSILVRTTLTFFLWRGSHFHSTSFASPCAWKSFHLLLSFSVSSFRIIKFLL